MSELDREQAGAIEDETGDNGIPDDEIEVTTMAAETTGQSSLKKMIRSFLEMFTLEKSNLILNMMNDSNWEKSNDFWTYKYKEKPLRNFDTVRSIFAHMTKIIQDTDWTEENTYAVELAVFEKPKITKQIIETMCQATAVEYRIKEE